MLEVLNNNTILKTITPFFEQNNGNAYIVGGFLRDCLLKRPSCDVDIVADMVCRFCFRLDDGGFHADHGCGCPLYVC